MRVLGFRFGSGFAQGVNPEPSFGPLFFVKPGAGRDLMQTESIPRRPGSGQGRRGVLGVPRHGRSPNYIQISCIFYSVQHFNTLNIVIQYACLFSKLEWNIIIWYNKGCESIRICRECFNVN